MQSPLTCSSQLFLHCRQSALEQIQSVIKPFPQGLVKEKAPDQPQSVIKPFRKGFVREGASEQLSASAQLQTAQVCSLAFS